MGVPVVIGFAVLTLFVAWLVFFEGAERIEGTIFSGMFFLYHAPEWSALGLKLFAGIGWLFLALWFGAALVDSGVRPLLMAGSGN